MHKSQLCCYSCSQRAFDQSQNLTIVEYTSPRYKRLKNIPVHLTSVPLIFFSLWMLCLKLKRLKRLLVYFENYTWMREEKPNVTGAHQKKTKCSYWWWFGGMIGPWPKVPSNPFGLPIFIGLSQLLLGLLSITSRHFKRGLNWGSFNKFNQGPLTNPPGNCCADVEGEE